MAPSTAASTPLRMRRQGRRTSPIGPCIQIAIEIGIEIAPHIANDGVADRCSAFFSAVAQDNRRCRLVDPCPMPTAASRRTAALPSVVAVPPPTGMTSDWGAGLGTAVGAGRCTATAGARSPADLKPSCPSRLAPAAYRPPDGGSKDPVSAVPTAVHRRPPPPRRGRYAARSARCTRADPASGP